MGHVRAWCGRWGRPEVLLGTLVAIVFVVLAVLVACSSDDEPGAVVRTATPTPTSTATATPTPTPTSTPDARETAGPGEAVEDLQELVDRYGYPDGTDFARVRIPSIGVDAMVGSRYVGGDGRMAEPGGPADIAWYDLSAWAGMGGRPGEGGNAIFSGHVDYSAMVHYADVRYRGLGVFSDLGLLSQGDLIDIDYNGETLQYQVVWRRQVEANSSGWGAIWSSDVAVDSITLYTCGGDFDESTLSYSQRVVVRAERV